MSTLAVGTVKSISSAAPVFQNTSGTEKGQLCKSWVNFNGVGTVAIRDSFNVSSITDNGNGDYTVTFSNAMSNANYCVTLGVKSPDTSDRVYATLGNSNQSDPSTTAFTILCERTSTGTDTNSKYVMASIFGDN